MEYKAVGQAAQWAREEAKRKWNDMGASCEDEYKRPLGISVDPAGVDVVSAPPRIADSKPFRDALRQYDDVLKPAHYNKGGVECIEALKASMSEEEFKGYLKGNVEKYIWRYRYKGTPLKDLEKARWYLDRLIDEWQSSTAAQGSGE
jgi:hypothetical protein